MNEMHEQNRRSWNHATRAHNSHKGDQAAFLRGGGSTLFSEEIDLLGDLTGLRVLHQQCNAGQDTLSIAARGVGAITGVDISDEAIEFATRLSHDTGIAARFVRSDVFEYLESTPDRFDVVFISYGALPWLSDIPRWGRGVARVLAPGGRLVLIEFHPLINLLDLEGSFAAPCGTGGGGARIDWHQGVGDYVAASDGALSPGEHVAPTEPYHNPEICHEWEWSVAEIVDAVARAGLHVEAVREYDYSNGCKFFPRMLPRDGKRWVYWEGGPRLPLMYSLVARRLP